MVIDRSGTLENVYMMSLVDENDLAEFLDETKETEKKRGICGCSSRNDYNTRTGNYSTAGNRGKAGIWH